MRTLLALGLLLAIPFVAIEAYVRGYETGIARAAGPEPFRGD